VIVAPPALAAGAGRLLDDRFRRFFNWAAVAPVSPVGVVARMAFPCRLGESLQSANQIRMIVSERAAVNRLPGAADAHHTVFRPDYPGTLRGPPLAGGGTTFMAADFALLDRSCRSRGQASTTASGALGRRRRDGVDAVHQLGLGRLTPRADMIRAQRRCVSTTGRRECPPTRYMQDFRVGRRGKRNRDVSR
jgi:hypothetical protein